MPGIAAYHLLGNIDFLLYRENTLLQGAGQIDFAEIVAEICLLLNEGDQAVFDLEENGGTGLDVLGEGSIADNCESLATRNCQLVCKLVTSRMNVRNWWVGRQVDIIDSKDVVFGVSTELELSAISMWIDVRPSLTFRGFLPGTECAGSSTRAC